MLKFFYTGMLSTLVVLGLVAVARVLANRASVARVERVREQVSNIVLLSFVVHKP